MKRSIIMAGALTLAFTAWAARPEPAPPGPASKPACWIEFASGQAPGAMSAEGAEVQVWRTTVSGVLIRRERGDVLIDTGFSANADAQMNELAPQKQAIARMSLSSSSFRRPAPEALAAAGEPLGRVATIVPTHAHYDHLGGAEDLPGARILLTPEEIGFLDREQQAPDIVAASNIAAVRSRLQSVPLTARSYLGFARSFDAFGDGSIVLVPLPGHTPGSVGVFFKVGGRPVLAIGDATWTLEAVERGLSRPIAMRAFADDDPQAADRQVKILAAFHRRHPEIAILPAHDRLAWEGVFAKPGCG